MSACGFKPVSTHTGTCSYTTALDIVQQATKGSGTHDFTCCVRPRLMPLQCLPI